MLSNINKNELVVKLFLGDPAKFYELTGKLLKQITRFTLIVLQMKEKAPHRLMMTLIQRVEGDGIAC